MFGRSFPEPFVRNVTYTSVRPGKTLQSVSVNTVEKRILRRHKCNKIKTIQRNSTSWAPVNSVWRCPRKYQEESQFLHTLTADLFMNNNVHHGTVHSDRTYSKSLERCITLYYYVFFAELVKLSTHPCYFGLCVSIIQKWYCRQ